MLPIKFLLFDFHCPLFHFITMFYAILTYPKLTVKFLSFHSTSFHYIIYFYTILSYLSKFYQSFSLHPWHCVVSLDKKLYPTFSLSTQVPEMGPIDILLGVTLCWTSVPSSGEWQYSQLLHATETGLWASLSRVRLYLSSLYSILLRHLILCRLYSPQFTYQFLILHSTSFHFILYWY